MPGDGGGGGYNPLDDIGEGLERLRKNPTQAIGNGLLQFGSAGIIGMNEDGSLTKGYASRGVDEGLGEVTGRNVARDAANKAEENLRQARIAEANRRGYELQKQEANERQTSSRIQSNANRARNGSASAGDIEAQLSTQFLGL